MWRVDGNKAEFDGLINFVADSNCMVDMVALEIGDRLLPFQMVMDRKDMSATDSFTVSRITVFIE
jgi:hypothetical protein